MKHFQIEVSRLQPENMFRFHGKEKRDQSWGIIWLSLTITNTHMPTNLGRGKAPCGPAFSRLSSTVTMDGTVEYSQAGRFIGKTQMEKKRLRSSVPTSTRPLVDCWPPQ